MPASPQTYLSLRLATAVHGMNLLQLQDSISSTYFLALFYRGQILSTDCLVNHEDVELINDGVKYILEVMTHHRSEVGCPG